MRYDCERGNCEAVEKYIDAGFAVGPLLADGSKQALWKWGKGGIQKWQVPGYFAGLGDPKGIAVLTGARSGGLEVVDFDHDAKRVFPEWCRKVGKLVTKLVIVKTGKGYHCYYRCDEIEGNQKLAMRMGQAGKPEVLIETRGEGGLVAAPGSPPKTNSRNVEYVVEWGDILNPTRITPEERRVLLEAARGFNEYTAPVVEKSGNYEAALAGLGHDANRPGDIYNRRASWNQVLEPHGWTELGGGKWRRPDKYEGVSAAVGGEHDSLYVFSSSVTPLEPGKAYSKFGVYALLNHAGDFKAATKALADAGFSENAELLAYAKKIEELFI